MGCLGLTGVHKVKAKKEMRLVLLGIAGSGKTTFCKQMQIIHKGGFEQTQAENFKVILRNNILAGMKLLCESAGEDISQEYRKKARFLVAIDENDVEWNEELVEKINSLWHEEAIQDAWHNRKESVLVQMDYLMDNFQKYLATDFTPTNDDILRARQRSTGESNFSFEDDENIWNLIDLGGQMSERSKWDSVFENTVNAVIFFLAIDEFDTANPETKSVAQSPTKLALALSILNEVMNGSVITQHKPSRIVFLNKSDLFQDKIKDPKRFEEFKKNLEYTGDQTFENCAKHIEEKIQEAITSDDLPTHTHVVCALNTETMKKVTEDIKMTIVTSSLKDMGIL